MVRDEEWEAATVIGGSVVEAFLLERLLGHPKLAGGKPPDDWKLSKMITVALDLGLIDETVAHVCNGARDFRNLIHAGKERAEAPCDRGTAFAAVAAVETLVATFGGTR